MPDVAPFPADGTAVFIDANILYYHFVLVDGLSDWSSDLLERIAQGRLTAATSSHAIAESVHKIMTAEASSRFSVPRPAIVNYLRHHPERIGELTRAYVAASHLERMGLSLLTADVRILVEAATISRAHGLMTNDALTVALMGRHGLTNIATNDDDFARVSDLTIWKPRI
jgi:predicted nucleic acid-binding protein